MVICIEGARNVGKSYLINQLNLITYKFPFAKIANQININNTNDQLHYLSLGADIAFLELNKNTNDKKIIDRNFLSSLVFGVQSRRISFETAVKQGKFIKENYNFKIIYIEAYYKEDNRNKDNYTIYNQTETIELYKRLINKIKLDIIYFHNNFDEDSVLKFISLINNI